MDIYIICFNKYIYGICINACAKEPYIYAKEPYIHAVYGYIYNMFQQTYVYGICINVCM